MRDSHRDDGEAGDRASPPEGQLPRQGTHPMSRGLGEVSRAPGDGQRRLPSGVTRLGLRLLALVPPRLT